MHHVTWGLIGTENCSTKFIGGNGADAKAKSLIALGHPVVIVYMGNIPVWKKQKGRTYRKNRIGSWTCCN